MRGVTVHILGAILCVILVSIGYAVVPRLHYDKISPLYFAVRVSAFDASVVGRYLMQFLVYGTVNWVLTVIREHRRRQKREREHAELALRASRLEAQLNQAKLQSLRAQLHPHFLFNSLNSLASLITHEETDDAYNMVACLARLLRASLDQIDRGMISLQKELEFIEQYL